MSDISSSNVTADRSRNLSYQINAPVGAIVAWPGPLSTLPEHWKLCNGEYLLSSAYPALLAVCQNYWGPYAGSGVNQSFKLPDLRGMFLRGVNEDRVDDYQDPDRLSRISTSGNPNEVGSTQDDQFQSHSHNLTKAVLVHKNAGVAPHEDMDPGAWAAFVKMSVSASGGNETRPKNAYVNWIVKAT